MTTFATTFTDKDRSVKLVEAVLERVRSTYKYNTLNELSADLQTQLYNFLCGKVNDRTRVIFSRDIPAEEGFAWDFFTDAERVMEVSFGKNQKTDSMPYVLFVSVKRKKRNRMEKFVHFCANRDLPTELIEEAIKLLEIDNMVEIVVCQKAGDWSKQLKKEKNSVSYIGQIPDAKTGSFIPNKPIGYVVRAENRLVLTNPQKNMSVPIDYDWFE